MLSDQEVDASIQFIAAALKALAADEGDLSKCPDIAERFKVLRDQYRERPESLAQRVSQLSELRGRFDELLSRRLALIVDRFCEVDGRLRAAQQEKAFWRGFLIRQADQTRQEFLNGTAGTVRVRSVRSRILPPAGGSDRVHLEELIRASGYWEKVSQLSRAKLERALAGNLFAGSEAEAIGQLCPATVRYQVTGHASGR